MLVSLGVLAGADENVARIVLSFGLMARNMVERNLLAVLENALDVFIAVDEETKAFFLDTLRALGEDSGNCRILRDTGSRFGAWNRV